MTAHYLFLVYIAVLAVGTGMARSRGLVWADKVFTLLASFGLLLIMSLRSSSVGTDTNGYRWQYNASYPRPEEPGYSLFSKIAILLGLDFQQFLTVAAAILVLALTWLILMFSMSPFVSILLHTTMGLYAMSLSGLRQTIAVAFTMLAFIALMKSKTLLFLILTLMAATFHNSAIMFLPVLLVARISIKRSTIVGLLVIGAMIVCMRPFYVLPLDIFELGKYGRYIDDVQSIPNPLSILVAGVIPMLSLLVTPRACFAGRGPSLQKPLLPILLAMGTINFLAMALSTHVFFINRFTYYFLPYISLLLPNAIAVSQNRLVNQLAPLMLLPCAIFYFMLSSNGGSLGIDDYVPFWGN